MADNEKKSSNFTKLIKNPGVKLVISVLYFIFVLIATLLFVRLFIFSDTYRSWKMTFLLSPYLGALIMGFMAYKKKANWKQILLFSFLGLTTTEKVGLVSIISFYYLLDRRFN